MNRPTRNQAKKGVVALGLVTLLFLSASSMHLFPSGLSLGRGVCSNVKDSILSEEKIGRILWSDYQNYWQYHVKNPNNFTNSSGLVNSLIDVFQSDKKVYDLADRRPECFTPSKNAYVRTQETETALIIKNLKTWVNSGGIFNQDFYPKYYSFYDDLNPSPNPSTHGISI